MKKFLFCLLYLFLNCFSISAQSVQEFLLKKNDFITANSKTIGGSVFSSTQIIRLVQNKNAPFVAVSFKINGINKSEIRGIQLKYSSNGSTESTTQSINTGHEIEDEENYVSELIFLNESTNEISLEIESLTLIDFDKNSLNLRAYYPSNTIKSVLNSQAEFRGSNDCSLPKTVSRSIWGAAYYLDDLIQYKNIPEYTTVTHLIVHHGSSPNVATNWAAVVLSYFDYHVNTNGWSDIGYNYLVAPDGTLFVGRGGGDNVIGAHYCGKNAHTMGVCMIGTYNDVLPTDTALQTLVKILTWKAKKETINLNGAALLGGLIVSNIDGHRSGCATDCPGDMVWAYLPKLRERVVATVNACTTITPINEFVESGFKISPNILKNEILNCQGNFKNNTRWQITDLNGRIHKSGNILTDSETFKTPIDNLGIGVYFLSVQNQFGVVTEKFLKVE